MKTNNLNALIIVGFTVFYMFSTGLVHEVTHKQIAESYGCNTSINYLPNISEDSFMSTEVRCKLSDSERISLIETQSNVENVGYHSILIGYFIIVAILFTDLKQG